MSTRGHRKKWTLVKRIPTIQYLQYPAHGPRRRPRVDVARGPRVDNLQTFLHGPKRNQNHFLRKKKQCHWRDLNSSLPHGSPMPNQLDHGGYLGLNEVYSSLYVQFLKIQKQKNGPRRVHEGTFLGSSEEAPARTSSQGPHLAREERQPKFCIPFLSSALGKRWRNSVAECLHLIASSSQKAQHCI